MDLVQHKPAKIIFTGRNAQVSETVIEQAKAISPSTAFEFVPIDMMDLASVNKAAETFLKQNPSRLDVVICNAGVMATDAYVTKDGYENQFGINHMAHHLLVKRLLPLLEKTAKSQGPNADIRIVVLTSLGFQASAMIPGGIMFDTLKSAQAEPGGEDMNKWLRYGQSKLANIHFTRELARRYPNITPVVVHPGTVWTDLIHRLSEKDKKFVEDSNDIIVPAEVGAYNTVWAATTDKKNLKNGGLYMPVGKPGDDKEISQSLDKELAERLWEWTEKEIEPFI